MILLTSLLLLQSTIIEIDACKYKFKLYLYHTFAKFSNVHVLVKDNMDSI